MSLTGNCRRVSSERRERIRVLIVNCHFDETRSLEGRPNYVPQGVGHVYLAGAFNPELAELRLHGEFYGGPLLDENVLAWPDMVALTGVTSSLDRMRQIAAYVRTLNPAAVIVAGGPAIRALPSYSQPFFDFSCLGDIEQLRDLVADIYGPSYAAHAMHPRFDLVNWGRRIGYIESSRNCNFACSFCALTGEGNRYQTYDLEYVRHQLEALGRRRYLLFVDNNFYGNDRAYFQAKLTLIRDFWERGAFDGWIALVTNDFFTHFENVDLVKSSGCLGLFSGVESFTRSELQRYGKKQNLLLPQVETISKCLSEGVVYQYGLIFDPSTRTLDDIHEELNFITCTPEIPLPAFLSLTIPLLGTPYFHECLNDRLFLPHTKLRDIDGSTLVLRPKDTLEEVVRFIIDMPNMRGYERRVLRHAYGFYRRYRNSLSAKQMLSTAGNAIRLCMPRLIHNPRYLLKPPTIVEQRTYVTTTQPLGPLYRPAFRVDSRYERFFQPTMITDAGGNLTSEVADDLTQKSRPTAGAAIAT